MVSGLGDNVEWPDVSGRVLWLQAIQTDSC